MTASIDQLPTDQLVDRAKAGSMNAFGELVARYQDRLLNFLRHRSASLEDAEDTTQETFIRAWRRLHQYDNRWQFSTWLFTIGARLAANRAKQRRTLPLHEPASDHARQNPAEAAGNAELSRNLWTFAQRHLSEAERETLWLRYVEDLAAADIARVLGRTTVGVRVLMHRARRKLARAIEPADARTHASHAAAAFRPCTMETAGVETDV